MSHEQRPNLDELLRRGADSESPDSGLVERIGSVVDHAAAVRRQRVMAGVGLAVVVLVTGLVLMRGGGFSPGMIERPPVVANTGSVEEPVFEEPSRVVEPARVAIHDADNMLIERVESSNPNVTILLMYETVRMGRVEPLPRNEGDSHAF